MNLEYGLFPVRHPAYLEANYEPEPVTPRKITDGKRCVICNTVYQPKNGKQLYCNDDCYRIAKAQKAKARKHARR